MRNFQDIVFIWTQTYREIFKSALEYLSVPKLINILPIIYQNKTKMPGKNKKYLVLL